MKIKDAKFYEIAAGVFSVIGAAIFMLILLPFVFGRPAEGIDNAAVAKVIVYATAAIFAIVASCILYVLSVGERLRESGQDKGINPKP
ncbi:MAG: hypothetical protein QME74_02650 [Candidatus Edwardsbacteria bacterium]|nr:hypothetical protein [Candidatus Edwardsbacteria bacterium]